MLHLYGILIVVGCCGALVAGILALEWVITKVEDHL